MALFSLRLRRALSAVTTTLHRSHSTLATQPLLKLRPLASSCYLLKRATVSVPFQSRSWTSYICRYREYKLYKEGDEIGPDTILFEGCDYNHWLITVDFGKENTLTPDQKVRTYEEICAKGLNVSVEEAKKRIYACSTTTYEGFQVEMTEEESEKFKDVPGVVFILPDSYIDPQNKIYGGDKYENGVITHRPPPVQYRPSGGRFRDRARNPDQPRYDRQGNPMPTRQWNPQYDRQGNRPPQQNYGSPQNYPPQQNQGPQQNYLPQQNYGPPQNYQSQQNYGPPPTNNRDYAPGGRDTFQADRRGPVPSYQGNDNQGQQGNYYSQEPRDFPHRPRDDRHPGQEFRGDNMSFASQSGGTYGQGTSFGYGQSYPGQGEGQRSSQVEQTNTEAGERNYAPMAQT
ncbi:hypothetical protein CFOL_v3_04723, partial [Cephalotus follicularis]